MAQVIFDVSTPNDGLGDELRDAFVGVNENFTELYTDKVDKEIGKDLSTNDFTDDLKTKLLGIEDGAEVNVQSDWSQSDNTADDYIKNKPTLNNYVNTIGFFDYNNDNTTPLTLVADTEKKLENDCVGAYTNIDHPTHGVTRLFDPTTNNIVLDELGVGDLVKLRVDINVTTATANQVFKCILRLGIGTANEFEIIIHEEQIKSTGAHQRTIFTGFYVGSEEVRLALGELVLVSDHAGSVVVNGFFFEGIKRNVNFVELSGGGITTPTLQEVALQGDEIINSAGNLKIVLDKEVNGVVLYELVSGTWEERGRYTSSDFQIGNGTGNYYILGSEFTGFSISQGTDIVQLTANSITKNGVEVVTEVPYTYVSGEVIFDSIVFVNQIRIKNTADFLAVLQSDNLTTNRSVQFQDIDYTGVADISQVPTTLAQLSTDSSNQRVSSTEKTSYASKVDEAPNDVNAYVRSALGWVVGYTKSAIDTLLGTKQNTLSYTPYKFIQVSDTPHTGTTAETILATATIAGNTFPSTEVLEALFGVNKTGTGGAYTIRLKINTSNTLSGATTIATFTAGSNTAQWTLMSRSFTLLGGNLRGYPFATSQVNDVMNIGGSLGSTAYNTANTLYMFWCVTLVSSSDSITPNLCNLTNN